MKNDIPDSRRFLRLPLEADVEVADGTHGAELCFESHNLSEGGLFLKSDFLLEVGQVVWVSFSLPGTGMNIRTRGTVVWVNKSPDENDPTDRPGMGVKFLDLNEAEQQALAACLHSVS